MPETEPGPGQHFKSYIEDTVGMYEYVAEDKNITIATSIVKDTGMTADRNRMRQVLARLLDSMIKYTPHGVAMVIEVRIKNESTL